MKKPIIFVLSVYLKFNLAALLWKQFYHKGERK